MFNNYKTLYKKILSCCLFRPSEQSVEKPCIVDCIFPHSTHPIRMRRLRWYGHVCHNNSLFA